MQGFEPRTSESESDVLPLHHTSIFGDKGGIRTHMSLARTHQFSRLRRYSHFGTLPYLAAPARFELTPEGVKDLRTTVALRGYIGAPDRTRTCN